MSIKAGDAIKVNDPAWRDAAGREYPAGRNHTKIGVIIEETDHKAGSDRLYQIKFDDGHTWSHWGSELKELKS